MEPQRVKRDYVQLLHLHERILDQLHRVRADLRAPITDQLLKAMRNRTGTAHDTHISNVVNAVEEAIRALKLSQSQIESSVTDTVDKEHEVEGISNLPAYLQRFLAERAGQPGFDYEVKQDEVRGWIICWKEFTNRGTVRGYGQICERPYAWLED